MISIPFLSRMTMSDARSPRSVAPLVTSASRLDPTLNTSDDEVDHFFGKSIFDDGYDACNARKEVVPSCDISQCIKGVDNVVHWDDGGGDDKLRCAFTEINARIGASRALHFSFASS